MRFHVLLAAGLALVLCPAVAQSVLKITRVPATTPPTDTLFVAGSFNSWNPHSVRFALHRNPDGTYQLSMPAIAGPAEYKFTRGSWATVEVDAHHQPVPNRRADFAASPGTTH